ncbi:MAG: pantoate--beta-alanine ligase [Gemmatimonadota bacterium]|nr:pantoate--beta-alanine ligase [Gemmatimonadota bacterium]
MRPELARTVAACRESLDASRRRGDRIALVPTMGYLHEGHLSLVDLARGLADRLVLSIFVNPTQFDSESDLEAYPRDLDRDLDLAGGRGVDLVFAPSVEEMYPEPPLASVTMRGITEGFEGAARPGHFDGVLTVVTKLFHVVEPHVAVFGRKDAQQAAAVRRLIADLDFPVELEVAPTVREPDGLAASSRNVRLSPDQRERALAIPRTLERVRELFRFGERDGTRLEDAMRRSLEDAPGVEPEYAAVVDRDRFVRVDTVEGPCVAAVAARVGPVRLIDNALLDPRGERSGG